MFRPRKSIDKIHDGRHRRNENDKLCTAPTLVDGGWHIIYILTYPAAAVFSNTDFDVYNCAVRWLLPRTVACGDLNAATEQ